METVENKVDQVPSRKMVIKSLKKGIKLASLQAKLQTLNATVAMQRANELEAFAKINHFSKQGNGDIVEHVVTQEDLDNNPELVKAGIKVGQKIGIPRSATVKSGNPDEVKKADEARASMKPVE